MDGLQVVSTTTSPNLQLLTGSGSIDSWRHRSSRLQEPRAICRVPIV